MGGSLKRGRSTANAKAVECKLHLVHIRALASVRELL